MGVTKKNRAGYAFDETVAYVVFLGDDNMKKFIVAIAIAALAATVNAQELVGSFPAEGGNITVTASGDVAAAGLDFTSASGSLVPAPGTDAAPFTFFLSNTANQVTYGNLGNNVTFADGSSTELSVGAAAGADDIVAAWGNGATPVAFPVGPSNPVVPEPASATLLGLAGVLGLAFRRRNR